jgi:hypothetical protein
VSGLVHHDPRTLFERAWSDGLRSGLITDQRRETLIREATRAIRKIASVLGTEFLREDLERAMRSMLGLVNLQLEKLTRGDVEAAARSIAEAGLIAHTRGASQAIKRVLAIESGLDPDEIDAVHMRVFEEAVVTEWAHYSFGEFALRERGAERARRRRAAAAALAGELGGRAPDAYHEPEQVIMTALLILAYDRKKAWIDDPQGFERLLGAVRRAPRRFDTLPGGVPLPHLPAVREVWAAESRRIVSAIVDPGVPLHRLVAGDPLDNPLHGWLVLPGDSLTDVDDLGEQTTSHWQALTKGSTDEARLLAVMLRGVFGFADRVPFGRKAAETLLRTTLSNRPPERVVRQWLEENAPHQYHAGLLELWEDFWNERETVLDASSGTDDYRAFMAAWLPMRAAPSKR